MTDATAGPPLGRRPHRRAVEGDVEVFVADEQHEVSVDTERWQRLAGDVLAAEGVQGDVEFALLFVDAGFIADLNQRFMDKAGPTDVLAFPIDDEIPMVGRSPDGGTTGPGPFPRERPVAPWLLGDVVICPTVASGNAPENVGSYPGHEGTLDDEIALLVVHGILHVLGMDHAVAAEEIAMKAREREHLDRLYKPGPQS